VFEEEAREVVRLREERKRRSVAVWEKSGLSGLEEEEGREVRVSRDVVLEGNSNEVSQL
jgi:hypothetical protein